MFEIMVFSALVRINLYTIWLASPKYYHVIHSVTEGHRFNDLKGLFPPLLI